MNEVNKDQIRQSVRENYKKVVLSVTDNAASCCGSTTCCGSDSDVSLRFGYSLEEIKSVPDGSNLGLGCGNPQTIAGLKEGEVVVDLGSGGGFDCFLASKQVGEKGKVIGVDMTPEMISKARSNAYNNQYTNVEFRLGEIENLPVANNSVDVIMSNCVINLSPDKRRVFHEAFRVLKSRGRLAISDIVLTNDLPDDIRKDIELYTGCISGSSPINELEAYLADAGFIKIQINPKDESKEFLKNWVPGKNIEDYIVSAVIKAIKP
ncbi:arsenite methyltransferase [Brevibacillus laterosporus]|uniref:arsenite methyltransferase n=1 Tax=Brevibacillus laterosporus TaxID=1465 RepID=UPI00035FC8FA|nr:arsenite methyltransferase [Brevibacillus laterosporus]ATO51555.1 arsenite S-adenosylmethyltransferase [Brevibacillus laterosporus DSM 25]MBG9805073.1 arsenite S-adenosylmethyltransferase [Brevibacillus laterosporus]MED2004417.1 arsenite methyltransferase [Brevibacillus laterosporus]MED4764048.1 arsenite methyltransferase [Brevibacillus laterosporus]TPH13692.1 methyltransferase domain-containing protein [Brevibacillus laterosporus]